MAGDSLDFVEHCLLEMDPLWKVGFTLARIEHHSPKRAQF